MSVKYEEAHWTQQYAQVMTLFLKNHYGNNQTVLKHTRLSLAILSRMSRGETYNVSIHTMARLEEACAEVIKELENAEKANKNGANQNRNGAEVDDFPRPPYGILRA